MAQCHPKFKTTGNQVVCLLQKQNMHSSERLINIVTSTVTLELYAKFSNLTKERMDTP